MKEEEYRKLDEAIYQLYHIYAAYNAKENKIKLVKFDLTDQSHLCMFYIASMAKKIFECELEVDCNIIDYLKLQKRFHKLVAFKKCRDTKDVMSCDTIVDLIESEYYIGILADAYREYYKK